MTVGQPATVESINQQVGAMANLTDSVLLQWHEFRTYVIGPGGGLAGLQTLGYTLAEATLLFNVSADMEQLYQVFIGGAAVTPAKDFRVSGLNTLYGTLVH